MTKYVDKIAIASFYSFISIAEPGIFLSKITALCMRKYLKGTVLIAREGLNGSLSGHPENLECALKKLKEVAGEDNLVYKINYAQTHPFSKLKVKLKPEIVTMGVENLDVQNLKGEYIEPQDWDRLASEKDVVLIDTRNDYEVTMGSFKGAINPQTETFRDFPAWLQRAKETLQDKKILMFCTGGIRCEKSTAYLKSEGIENVYHLKGGILQYLEDTGNKNQMWTGSCFVFDDRVAVDVELAPNYTERS